MKFGFGDMIDVLDDISYCCPNMEIGVLSARFRQRLSPAESAGATAAGEQANFSALNLGSVRFDTYYPMHLSRQTQHHQPVMNGA
jgi:hypothetical protein